MSGDEPTATGKRRGKRWIGGGIVATVTLGLGTIDLFAGPGYEMALAAGLLVPATTAIVTALELSKQPRQPLSMLARGLETGAIFAATAYLVALLHGLRTGFCDLASGSMLFALGPGVGALLGGAWGALAGELATRTRRRRLTATVAGLAGPLGSALLQVAIFYSTPMVFAFDPFAGYFSGALYDTILASDELVSYRVASAATLFSIYIGTLHMQAMQRDGRRHLRFRSLGRPGLLLLGAAAGLGSLTSVVYGSDLDHWQTRGTIAEGLGGHLERGRCSVIYDVGLDRTAMDRFADECEAHVASLSQWLDMPIEEPITVFMFSSRGQKRAYMGAGRVSVAKPWRREIYVQQAGFPHGVVRHELVHAVTEAIGSGPFKVAGGILPNPGLVEGIAEAAAPRDDNLSGHEWAAAMRAINVLPRTNQLFGLAFFGQASSAGYTAAGSFVNHVRETHGIAAVKRWYGGEAITDITSQNWSQLEQSWWARLDAIELTDAARISAELRFDRPGVFSRRCPHEVDELLDEGLGRVGGDIDGAFERLRAVLALDPGNIRAKMGLAQCHDRLGDVDAAHDAYAHVATFEGASKGQQLTAVERRGDLDLRSHHAEQARARYAEVLPVMTSEGRLRTLEMKIHYADHPLARAALVALLIGTDERGADHTEALDLITQWRDAEPEEGTPFYLLGRQHFNNGRFALALKRFQTALEKQLPVERTRTETLRLELIAACAIGRVGDARKALERYRAHPLVPPAKRRMAASLVDRCSQR